MAKRSQGVRNKNKGSNAERLYAQKFRDLGYPLCQTSRYASRLHDDSKIDLVHIPFNIQIKAGVQANLNPGKELMLMESCIKNMFPEYDLIHNFPKLLIHHKHVGAGNKRTDEDSLVYMSLQRFQLYKQVFPNLKYSGIKKGNLQSNSEFKNIVWMNYNYFVENILLKLNGNKKG